MTFIRLNKEAKKFEAFAHNEGNELKFIENVFRCKIFSHLPKENVIIFLVV